MMNKIIGNQDRERQSKVDTEKWKEHAEYYNTLRNTKNKTEAQTPIETPTLEKILQYDSEGRPKIELHTETLIRTVVNTKTQEEYDKLMQIYETGGWILAPKGDPNQYDPFPTTSNIMKVLENNTCVTAGYTIGPRTTYQGIITFSTKKYCTSRKYKIQDLKKFCERQNITPQMLKELNEWYDTHKPDRASRGK